MSYAIVKPEEETNLYILQIDPDTGRFAIYETRRMAERFLRTIDRADLEIVQVTIERVKETDS